MSHTLTPRKLESVLKEVTCPNCRYKFKTPRVAVYPSNNLQQSSISIKESQNIPETTDVRPKHLSILLDFDIDKSEHGMMNMNKQDDVRSSAGYEKNNKSFMSSRKESLALAERKMSSLSKKSNSKSPQYKNVPSIRISTQKKQIAEMRKSIQKKLKNCLSKSIQCDSFSLNSQPMFWSKQKHNIQKSNQNNLNIKINSPKKAPTSSMFQQYASNKEGQIYTYQAKNKMDYASGPSYYAIKMLDKQSREIKELMVEMVQFYKREPFMCELLPSYLKAMVLKYKD